MSHQMQREATADPPYNPEELLQRCLGRIELVDRLLQQFHGALEQDLGQDIPGPLDDNYICRIMPLIQERAKTLAEIPGLVDFFFIDNLEYDTALLTGKMEPAQALDALKVAMAKLENLDNWLAEPMEQEMRPLCAELQLKPAVFFGMLRVAVTGRTVSPPLFQTMEVLGRERSFIRLNAALQKLQSTEM